MKTAAGSAVPIHYTQPGAAGLSIREHTASRLDLLTSSDRHNLTRPEVSEDSGHYRQGSGGQNLLKAQPGLAPPSSHFPEACAVISYGMGA